jgi:DNA polymerase-3 subunit gamma/tau
VRLDEDDMIATNVPAMVAPTTIVIRPAAIPNRGRTVVCETPRRSLRERPGEDPVTSSIVGGVARRGFRGKGSFPPSSAKKTNDGLVAASSAVGGDAPASAVGGVAPASAASTVASSVTGAGLAGGGGSTTEPGDADAADDSADSVDDAADAADDAASVDNAGAPDSIPAPFSEPRCRLESERSTSIACS